MKMSHNLSQGVGPKKKHSNRVGGFGGNTGKVRYGEEEERKSKRRGKRNK